MHQKVIVEGLAQLLTRLTDSPSIEDCWRKLIGPDDVIGLKFNRSGQATIGTTPAMAAALVESLRSAGWSADRIILIEAPAEVAGQAGVGAARSGFELDTTDFGSGKDNLASCLRQVSKIINVPFLKTHNIAGFTCGMKNLAYGLIRHPARFHANHCCPYIADICALPAIRDKVVLTIVDALRVTFADGPLVRPELVEDCGTLIAGTDPVAVDAIGLMVLNESRRRRGLDELGPVSRAAPYLYQAHRKGLGIGVLQGIDLIHVGDG